MTMRCIIVVLLVLVVAACDDTSITPTGPSPAQSALTVTSVNPNSGPLGSTVVISGSGFSPDATVTMGEPATDVTVVNSTEIRATTPRNASGIVDVVITNPGGANATLGRAFTYEVVTLTPSATTLAPRERLTLTWTAPHRRNSWGDWIGLFALEDLNSDYEKNWWTYASSTSGTETLNAPVRPGQYEFRYLLDDGYVDVARSATITVR